MQGKVHDRVGNETGARAIEQRGIDFAPTDNYLQEVRLAGCQDELVNALKSAKVTKPEHVDAVLQARQTEVRQQAARGGIQESQTIG